MIKLLTFKTNHSIMGDVTETSSMFIISKPVQVIMQPTKDGASMGFVPYVQFCDEWKTGITIKKDDTIILILNKCLKDYLYIWITSKL